MNILFVSAVLPYPLHSGGQIRIYELLKRLSTRHRISLVSFIRSDAEREHQTNLGFCHSVHFVMRGRAWQPKYYAKALVSSYPLLLSTYDHSGMRGLLEQLIANGQFDGMHLEPFYVWPSIPKVSLPLVVSEHNIEYDVYASYARRFRVPLLRPFLSWDVAKLRTWERYAWRNADALTAVSEQDASVMEEYLGHPVPVVSNGVDLDAFRYHAPVRRRNPVVLFVGNFRWHPNTEAAELLAKSIFPDIKKHYPDARLRIVGRDAPAKLKERVRKLGGEIREDVLDIIAEYCDADVLIAPHAIGGGTKFKMLEAMATGLPIVTSKAGAWGLSMEPNIHYLEAQRPEEFVARIRALWTDASLGETIARRARRLVEEKYNWDHIARTLEGVWKTTYEKR